jgi:hypothetical protein
MHPVVAISKKMEYFQYANEDWSKFLGQCKRAINKLSGYKVGVKYDFWSKYISNCYIDG